MSQGQNISYVISTISNDIKSTNLSHQNHHHQPCYQQQLILKKADLSELNQNILIDSTDYYQAMESTKENPMLTNAMPIPKNNKSTVDFSDYNLIDFNQSQSSQFSSQDQHFSYITVSTSSTDMFDVPTTSDTAITTNSNAMWSEIGIGDSVGVTKEEPFHMDEDDIMLHGIDKNDLYQPTLAELNDDTILEDLNFDEFITKENVDLFLSNHHTLTTLQPSRSLLTSVPLQQHQQNQLYFNQPNLTSFQTSSSPIVMQGIPIGRDVFYDEQTNTSYDIIYQPPTTRSLNSSNAFSPGSHNSSNSPNLLNSISPTPPNSFLGNSSSSNNNSNNNISTLSNNKANSKIANNNEIKNYVLNSKPQQSALHELLQKRDYTLSLSPDHGQLGKSVPGPSNLMHREQVESFQNKKLNLAQSLQAGASRLSSSAPTHSSHWEQHHLWQRREPRQHLLSTGSLAEALGSTSSLSTGGILSPEAQEFSHDEGYEDSDSEQFEDYSSDNDSGNEDNCHVNKSKKERFFWQYNVQAKGPKGQRLVIKTKAEDPHVLNEVTDPVFSSSCSVRGIKVIKHSGKARKGDGNDLTPNPRKLHNIGKELDKLGRTINDMTPVSELPFNVRPKSRKEKNKLASRACRLKKKAQHEANKIKLFGLETEHKRLIYGINEIKKALAYKCSGPIENTEDVNNQIEQIVKSSTGFQIAGISTEFVNTVLEKVKSGIPSGGLEDI